VFYVSFVCISAYANVYFKTILRERLRAGLLSGLPSTAPPPVSVSTVLGTLAVWILNHKKRKKVVALFQTGHHKNSEVWTSHHLETTVQQHAAYHTQTSVRLHTPPTRLLPACGCAHCCLLAVCPICRCRSPCEHQNSEVARRYPEDGGSAIPSGSLWPECSFRFNTKSLCFKQVITKTPRSLGDILGKENKQFTGSL